MLSFFSKEVVNSKENKYFKILLIINCIEYITEISMQFIVRSIGIQSLIVDIFLKLYLMAIFTWFTFFSIYTFIICLNKKDENRYERNFKLIKNINLLLWVVGCIVLAVLPFGKFYELEKMYAYGTAVETLKVFLGFYMIIWMFLLLINLKKIKNKKYAPLFLVLVCLGLNVIIQSIDPSILIATTVGTFICYIMYFTIENPDLKMIRQLELAKNQAEKANRAKTDFLSSMSHEIRTPLNAIKGFSSCIATAESLDEAKEDAADIVMASDNLLEIVNGILDISKIEADKMELEESNYNVVEEFNSIVRMIETRIGDKPIEFKSSFAPDLPYALYGDSGKVKQIITNLLTNAVKYTEKGEINFDVKCVIEKNSCKLQVIVSDTGRGIKDTQTDKLFTKFNRLDSDMNTTIEGTGLGLAITKSLVEMMGGKIVVQSKYGEGSKFTAFIPQKLSQNTSETKKEQKIETKTSFENKKVLLVDDNKLNLKIATKLLKQYNLDIEEVLSGFECIEKIENNNKYDIIFTDIMMPKMSGVEMLKKLKETDNFNTPVIALTADAMEGKSNKYIEVGFNDYLSKPIDNKELNRILNKFLNDNYVEEIKTIEKSKKNNNNKEIKINEETPQQKPKPTIIPITDEDIEELNRLFGPPTLIADQRRKEQEQNNNQKGNVEYLKKWNRY